MKKIIMLTAVISLAGFSCQNKIVSVNVNVNAAAKSVTNAVNAVNTNAATQLITKEAAVAKAKAVFIAQEGQGVDFSQGPCISNDLLPGWVADVAHNPRQPVDNLPENQCPAYHDGTAQHYVELDTEGQLIFAE